MLHGSRKRFGSVIVLCKTLFSMSAPLSIRILIANTTAVLLVHINLCNSISTFPSFPLFLPSSLHFSFFSSLLSFLLPSILSSFLPNFPPLFSTHDFIKNAKISMEELNTHYGNNNAQLTITKGNI